MSQQVLITHNSSNRRQIWQFFTIGSKKIKISTTERKNHFICCLCLPLIKDITPNLDFQRVKLLRVSQNFQFYFSNPNLIRWDSLFVLMIENKKLNYKEIKILVQKQWPQLQSLSLVNCGVDDISATLIFKKFNQIEGLSFSNFHTTKVQNNITKLGVMSMLSYNFQNLLYLNLSHNCLQSQGIKYLTKVSMENLKQLQLEDCHIGNNGVKHLTKGKWKLLNYLFISNNYFSLEATESLFLNNWEKLVLLQSCSQKYKNNGELVGLFYLTIAQARPVKKFIYPQFQVGSISNQIFLSSMENIYDNRYNFQ